MSTAGKKGFELYIEQVDRAIAAHGCRWTETLQPPPDSVAYSGATAGWVILTVRTALGNADVIYNGALTGRGLVMRLGHDDAKRYFDAAEAALKPCQH